MAAAVLHLEEMQNDKVESAAKENGNEDLEDDYSMWSRPFTFGSQKVRVEEEWGVGIGGTVWEGGVLLAQYISSDAFDSQKYSGKRCIELGAGVSGLPSIAAAHLDTFDEIVVTDIEECIEGLSANLTANLPASSLRLCSERDQMEETSSTEASSPKINGWSAPQSVVDTIVHDMSQLPSTSGRSQASKPGCPTFEREGPGDVTQDSGSTSSCTPRQIERAASQSRTGSSDATATCSNHEKQEKVLQSKRQTPVTVRVLDWKEDVQSFQPPFDVVLVADVVYIVELMEDLVQCLHNLSSQKTTIFLAYYERSAAAGKVFWQMLPKYFCFVKVPEETYGVKSQADNLGIFKLTLR